MEQHRKLKVERVHERHNAEIAGSIAAVMAICAVLVAPWRGLFITLFAVAFVVAVLALVGEVRAHRRENWCKAEPLTQAEIRALSPRDIGAITAGRTPSHQRESRATAGVR